jgi:hypothetical protein
MSLKKWIFLAGNMILLSGCNRTPVVIQPGVFTQDLPTVLHEKLTRNDKCIVDLLNGINAPVGEFTFKSGEPLNMVGWAFDPEHGAPEIYMQLVSPGLTYTALAERTPRPDINQLFKTDAAWTTGFRLHATQNIEPNIYELRILQPYGDGVAQCKPPIVLKIEPAKSTN